ncbi:MAG TPA: hypothetical protein VMU16_14490 [Candidatus Binataceae bacterium]|nr:hypothetical protein [Candidatus Binataceae bacterium]
MNRQEIIVLRQQAQNEFDLETAGARKRFEERMKALDVIAAMLPEEGVDADRGRNRLMGVDTTTTPHRPDFGNLTMIDAVRNVFDMWPGRTWNVVEVEEKLRQHGFEFTAQVPQGSLNTALARLRERGVIEVVRQGAGRRPTTYRLNRAEAAQIANAAQRVAAA